MLSNEGEDHSNQETEAEYTGVINLSGLQQLYVRVALSKMPHISTMYLQGKVIYGTFLLKKMLLVYKIVRDVPGTCILEACVFCYWQVLGNGGGVGV